MKVLCHQHVKSNFMIDLNLGRIKAKNNLDWGSILLLKSPLVHLFPNNLPVSVLETQIEKIFKQTLWFKIIGINLVIIKFSIEPLFLLPFRIIH